jgi:serine/threonine protein kinase/formylglycine-generating enzyme required for sulfatase activity/dienelactone hydrolase
VASHASTVRHRISQIRERERDTPVKADSGDKAKQLFREALQLRSSEWAAFVAAIGDENIRAGVVSLLASEGDRGTSSTGGLISAAAQGLAKESLNGRILGHFRIVREIGRGGMGEVYVAQDLKLHRLVALKLLPAAFQQDPERARRFEREARAAAALNHPNIMTVYEVGEWEGQRFIAAEFVEGETLAQHLSNGPLAVTKVLRLGVQIAEALAAAHEAGIVHRDLKPANVMLRPDETVKVLDFGLARFSQRISESDETETQTAAGRILGTPAYMSPEQVRGQIADARSDLWSLGVVLYEVLANRRPFEGDSNGEIQAAIIAREPVLLRTVNPKIPAEVERLVAGLLMKDRERRHSAAEVARELKRLSSKEAEPAVAMQRRRFVAVAVLALLVIVGASGALFHRWSKRQWARYEAIPQIHTLTDKGDYWGAYRLTMNVASIIPDEPALLHLWPEVSQLLSVRSDPPGAAVMWKPYAELNSQWQALGRTPVESNKVPAGALRLRLEMTGYEPIEVGMSGLNSQSAYQFELERLGASQPKMVRVPRRALQSQIRGIGELHLNRLDEFLIDRYEVTNRDFKKFVENGGYARRDYWKVPFVKDGRTLLWEQAMKQFVDPTGQPGPSTWEAGTYPDLQGDYPVTGVSWYEAAAYAEFAGKHLPTVYHWIQAANPNESTFQIPLSNFSSAHTLRVGGSEAVGLYGTYDIAGNAREWCWNQSAANRFILGGSWVDPSYMLERGQTASPWDRSSTNGFRCMKYLKPNPNPDTLTAPLTPYHPPDYFRMKPASDEVFDIYKRLYSHEHTPLNAVVESTDESSDLWRREKVHFDAGYGNEHVIAYLFLPKQGKPPYQCVVYFPSDAALRRGSGETIQPESYILRSGRAMLYPIYKGTYERFVPGSADDAIQVRDETIAASKDLGRSIDYLSSRKDIDSEKLAYLGASWGAEVSPIVLAVESRLKTAVLLSGGMNSFYGALPEINAVNFLGRVKIPILMVNGRYDSILPVETAQTPMFRLIGTPAADKRHVILISGHSVNSPEVRNETIREVLSWLDRYLGKP